MGHVKLLSNAFLRRSAVRNASISASPGVVELAAVVALIEPSVLEEGGWGLVVDVVELPGSLVGQYWMAMKRISGNAKSHRGVSSP